MSVSVPFHSEEYRQQLFVSQSPSHDSTVPNPQTVMRVNEKVVFPRTVQNSHFSVPNNSPIVILISYISIYLGVQVRILER